MKEKGKLHTAAAAVGGSLQQSGLSPHKRQTTFSFEHVKEHMPEPAAVSNKGLLSEAMLTQSILSQMSYTGSHKARGRLFLEVCFELLLNTCGDLKPFQGHSFWPLFGTLMHTGEVPQPAGSHCCHLCLVPNLVSTCQLHQCMHIS